MAFSYVSLYFFVLSLFLSLAFFFFFFLMIRPPPISTLFPYTTLFRSVVRAVAQHDGQEVDAVALRERLLQLEAVAVRIAGNINERRVDCRPRARPDAARVDRSEGHTSELQSHVNLVCRLLLEKKKKNI